MYHFQITLSIHHTKYFPSKALNVPYPIKYPQRILCKKEGPKFMRWQSFKVSYSISLQRFKSFSLKEYVIWPQTLYTFLYLGVNTFYVRKLCWKRIFFFPVSGFFADYKTLYNQNFNEFLWFYCQTNLAYKICPFRN